MCRFRRCSYFASGEESGAWSNRNDCAKRQRLTTSRRSLFKMFIPYNLNMSSLEQIAEFLSIRRLAVVGVSRNPQEFSRTLFREFLKRGYDTVPVHPSATEIEGRVCLPRLQDINPPVAAVLLMTSPAVTEQVVRDCAESGVTHVWMYRAGGAGAVTGPAIRYCESQGIDVIAGECPFMFFRDSGFFHRLHGAIRKITRKYPQPRSTQQPAA